MEPEEVLRQFEARINRHRFEDVEALLSDDAVFWFGDGSYSRKAEIGAAFERTWQTLHNDTYWLTNTVWLAKSDLAAVCIYQFNWRTDIDGTPHQGKGRGTTALRREEDGWKIVHEHLSPFPRNAEPGQGGRR